jgi:hypothetical protein
MFLCHSCLTRAGDMLGNLHDASAERRSRIYGTAGGPLQLLYSRVDHSSGELGLPPHPLDKKVRHDPDSTLIGSPGARAEQMHASRPEGFCTWRGDLTAQRLVAYADSLSGTSNATDPCTYDDNYN